jgi:large subunit ribosomal protein L21
MPLAISRIDSQRPVRVKTRASGFERGRKMFAVFKTGGKQYRVAAEDVLKVDKVKGEPGEIVEFGEVLVVGGDNVTLGVPTVVGATVAAEVLEQARGPKIIAFKKRRRKNSRRKIGHRQEFTLVRITEILTDGKKPSKQAQPRPKRAPVTAAPDQSADHRSARTPRRDRGNRRRKKPRSRNQHRRPKRRNRPPSRGNQAARKSKKK